MPISKLLFVPRTKKSGADTVLRTLRHSFALISDKPEFAGSDVPAGVAAATPTSYHSG